MLHEYMPFLYEMAVASLPPRRQDQLIAHIEHCFGRPFTIERLQEFDRAVVYQDQGQLIGLALVRMPAEDGSNKPPTLECVCVQPSHRGRGIGSEILQFSINDLGLHRLRLHVDRVTEKKENIHYTRLCEWYERMGFTCNYADEKECELEWTVNRHPTHHDRI